MRKVTFVHIWWHNWKHAVTYATEHNVHMLCWLLTYKKTLEIYDYDETSEVNLNSFLSPLAQSVGPPIWIPSQTRWVDGRHVMTTTRHVSVHFAKHLCFWKCPSCLAAKFMCLFNTNLNVPIKRKRACCISQSVCWVSNWFSSWSTRITFAWAQLAKDLEKYIFYALCKHILLECGAKSSYLFMNEDTFYIVDWHPKKRNGHRSIFTRSRLLRRKQKITLRVPSGRFCLLGLGITLIIHANIWYAQPLGVVGWVMRCDILSRNVANKDVELTFQWSRTLCRKLFVDILGYGFHCT